MIGDLSALECLKDFRYELSKMILRIESGQKLHPDDIDIKLLLRTRECLASARTEEHYISEQEATSELPSQGRRLTDRPDYGYLEKKGWTRVSKKDNED